MQPIKTICRNKIRRKTNVKNIYIRCRLLLKQERQKHSDNKNLDRGRSLLVKTPRVIKWNLLIIGK